LRIDRKLNLVVPLNREGGSLYVYSVPISSEVFQQYFMVISKMFSALMRENLGWLGGPRVSAMMLRDIATNTMRSDHVSNWWSGPDGVEQGLMGEIRRLTNVFMPSGYTTITEGEGDDATSVKRPTGWEMVQYEDAIKRELLDEEEISEVEGALVFFTVNSAMHKRENRGEILGAAAGLWGWLITSLPILEFRSSLTTWTPAADTGKAAMSPSQLSIPS
jgi:hypothetical protein